jgi:hypothetical protein
MSLLTGAILLAALIVFVENHNGNGLATQSPQAVQRADREAAIVVAQDQVPHVVRLGPTAAPRSAIVRVVRAAMNRLVDRGVIDGPLQRVSCRGRGGGAARRAFTCIAVAQDVNYPFLGVVDVPARTLTYCKRDEPPVPSQDIPVSRRCQA